VAVCPLDQLAQVLGVDPLSSDADTDTRAQRTGRCCLIHAEEATVVGLAVDGHLKFLKRYADSAARMAITVASQLA
jgi:hypothetical protein